MVEDQERLWEKFVYKQAYGERQHHLTEGIRGPGSVEKRAFCTVGVENYEHELITMTMKLGVGRRTMIPIPTYAVLGRGEGCFSHSITRDEVPHRLLRGRFTIGAFLGLGRDDRVAVLGF